MREGERERECKREKESKRERERGEQGDGIQEFMKEKDES